jgi:hypothetical protein
MSSVTTRAGEKKSKMWFVSNGAGHEGDWQYLGERKKFTGEDRRTAPQRVYVLTNVNMQP